MNLQQSIDKLLYAIRLKGKGLRINTVQFYSDKTKKYCTKYIVYEEHPNRDGEEFYNKIELLKYLAEEYKESVEASG